MSALVSIEHPVLGTTGQVPRARLAAFVAKGWQVSADGAHEPGAASSGESTSATADGPPPRAGKGSGLAAWVTYARSLGLEVTDDAERADVIAAVDDLLANPNNNTED